MQGGFTGKHVDVQVVDDLGRLSAQSKIGDRPGM